MRLMQRKDIAEKWRQWKRGEGEDVRDGWGKRGVYGALSSVPCSGLRQEEQKKQHSIFRQYV